MPLGFSALRDGPNGIDEAFQGLRGRPGKPQDGPQARYGILHRWFSGQQGRRPEYDRLRDLFRAHIIGTWPLRPGSEVLGEKVLAPGVFTVASAAEHWRIPARKLRKALAAQRLVSAAGSFGKARVETFPEKAALQVIRVMEDSISRPEAIQRLGLTENQLLTIEKAGVLPVVRPGPNLRPRHARAAVVELLDKIDARISGPADDGNPDWVTVFRMTRLAKTSLPMLLRQILDGHLTEVRAVAGQTGIARLRLALPDVLALEVPDPEADRPGRRAVAQKLRAGEGAVVWLVAQGHLSCCETFVPGTRLRKWSFDPDEVAAFDETYATVSRLSDEWGMQRPDVQKLMSMNHVSPKLQNASGKIQFYGRTVVQAIPR